MPKKVLLLSLQTFSTTGGIQKMTRTLSYSLYQLAAQNNWRFRFWSVYDSNDDLMSQYLPVENFKGFANNKFNFFMNIRQNAKWPDIIIISHINLAIAGLIIKFLNPKCKLWLVAHGIEVWRPISMIKKRFLKKCEKILCVSAFTRQELIRWHSPDVIKCEVLNNAVDPFMKLPSAFLKPQYLLDKYKLSAKDPVIFTLARMASTEKDKGYDQVITSISNLKSQFPNIKYILAGRCDEDEKTRIMGLIAQYDVNEQVILTGPIDETELTGYFLTADLFVMPSKKEGFGLVFIEALACGLPVVCGNSDGSMDAIRNGELGTGVDADNEEELKIAITGYLKTSLTDEKRQFLQKKCMAYFGEPNYRAHLQQLLTND